MTTIEQAKSAIKENLYQIFGEEDVTKRKGAIERLWTSSDKCLLVAPGGVFHGHEGISKCVDAILSRSAGWKFKDKGNLHSPHFSLSAVSKLFQVMRGWYPQTATVTSAQYGYHGTTVRARKVRWWEKMLQYSSMARSKVFAPSYRSKRVHKARSLILQGLLGPVLGTFLVTIRHFCKQEKGEN